MKKIPVTLLFLSILLNSCSTTLKTTTQENSPKMQNAQRLFCKVAQTMAPIEEAKPLVLKVVQGNIDPWMNLAYKGWIKPLIDLAKSGFDFNAPVQFANPPTLMEQLDKHTPEMGAAVKSWFAKEKVQSLLNDLHASAPAP